MRTILKGAVFLLSLILCFFIIARIAAAPAKEKPVEDTYNDASSTVSISPIETVLEPSPPDEEPEQVEEEWPYPISQEEIELIALVTMAEAEGETELGQRLVIDTILNRVDDSHFPDNVTDVIFQPNQFTSMWNGRVDRCYVKEELVELVQEERWNGRIMNACFSPQADTAITVFRCSRNAAIIFQATIERSVYHESIIFLCVFYHGRFVLDRRYCHFVWRKGVIKRGYARRFHKSA